MNNPNLLRLNIEKVHTTELGKKRIKKNLKMDTEGIVTYCKDKISKRNCKIQKRGKNWYCEIDNIRITVNASSYTIITANIIE